MFGLHGVAPFVRNNDLPYTIEDAMSSTQIIAFLLAIAGSAFAESAE